MEKDTSSSLPSFDFSCLSRVEGPSLDPQKKWYVLSKEIIGTLSARLRDFAHSVSKIFPDEVRSVAARELRPAKSGSLAAHKTLSDLRETCTFFPRLVSVLDFCGKERFLPMVYLSRLFLRPLSDWSTALTWSHRRRRISILARKLARNLSTSQPN